MIYMTKPKIKLIIGNIEYQTDNSKVLEKIKL